MWQSEKSYDDGIGGVEARKRRRDLLGRPPRECPAGG